MGFVLGGNPNGSKWELAVIGVSVGVSSAPTRALEKGDCPKNEKETKMKETVLRPREKQILEPKKEWQAGRPYDLPTQQPVK